MARKRPQATPRPLGLGGQLENEPPGRARRVRKSPLGSFSEKARVRFRNGGAHDLDVLRCAVRIDIELELDGADEADVERALEKG